MQYTVKCKYTVIYNTRGGRNCYYMVGGGGGGQIAIMWAYPGVDCYHIVSEEEDFIEELKCNNHIHYDILWELLHGLFAHEDF